MRQVKEVTSRDTGTILLIIDWPPLFLDCGVRPLRGQGRIVGGEKSAFGDWPWQVRTTRSPKKARFNVKIIKKLGLKVNPID